MKYRDTRTWSNKNYVKYIKNTFEFPFFLTLVSLPERLRERERRKMEQGGRQNFLIQETIKVGRV